MAGERILIVEDETIVQLHLRKILERFGYRVTGAAVNATEALELAAEEPPDLALMDIRLSGPEDGIETARELRRRVGCPVVFLTAYADEPTVERAREVEPAGYLIKPFDDDDVRAMLATALTKERAVRRVEEHGRDLTSILDELEVGTAMLDATGHLSFLSPSAARLLGVAASAALGRSWRRVIPVDERSGASLEVLLAAPPEGHRRVPVMVDEPGASPRRVEIDVRSDPRDSAQRILFCYDTTEVHDLRRRLQARGQFHDMVGSSPAMERVYEQIRQAAEVGWPVMIEGETGTGKELVARAVHDASARRDKPFVAVNCAGLTDSLLASQLFGHRRGAFTGAVADHKGFFEVASGGTLFLDEIGDVSMAVQTSLLRVLEDQRITPLGHTQSRQVDVRVLTATHRDLAAEVEAGRFRADLLYRIRVARVRLPPLRERGEDISLLAAWFLDRCRAITGKPVSLLGSDALERLLAYDWPGNVRELKSAIEHAVIRCRGAAVEAADLPPELAPAMVEEQEEEDEKARILGAIEKAGGNRSRAARILGISRATLYRRIDELGI